MNAGASTMAGKLKDRVAVITAGASGMGLAAGRLFAEEGAKVVLADLNGEAAEKSAKSIRDNGGKAWSFQLDVSSVEQLRKLFRFVEEEFGILHVLFNHAGV